MGELLLPEQCSLGHLNYCIVVFPEICLDIVLEDTIGPGSLLEVQHMGCAQVHVLALFSSIVPVFCS